MQSVVADSCKNPAACADTITIACYNHEIPSFVDTEIDRLYQHLGRSLSNFSVMKKLAGASTYVARKGAIIVTVLLFRRERDQVTVSIVRQERQCDIVGVATIDGQVYGSAIDFRICDNYFMHVIAHLAAKLMRVLRTLKHSNMGDLLSNHSAEKTG
jgi:hypothetical protein